MMSMDALWKRAKIRIIETTFLSWTAGWLAGLRRGIYRSKACL